MNETLGAIGDVATQVTNNQAEKTTDTYRPVTNVWKPIPPFWEVVQQSGGTYSAGTSWITQFDVERNNADRMEYRIVTASGELLDPQVEGNTAVGPRLYTLQIYCEQPMNVKCTFSITGSSARIQLFVNGAFTEYTTPQSQYVTLEFVEGYNTVQIASNTNTDLVLFKGKLFDGIISQWVDPLGSRNPQREGFISTGGGGGVPSSTYALVEAGLGL